jgi:uncharacterized protein with PQ loop repeat
MLDVVVGCFGVLMGASPMFQVARILRRRHSADVSLEMLGVVWIGAVLWLVYGFDHGLPVMIIANVVGVLANAVAIAVTLRFRHAPLPGRS